MRDEWAFPGSKWWKFDFHTHTPASSDYQSAAQDTTPRDWLKQAMCAGLDCVAVTDHNSGKWIDRLKAEYGVLEQQENKPEWYRNLTIFPSVEITVAESASRIHLLAIFDPEHDRAKIDKVLGACGVTGGGDNASNMSTSASFVDTVKVIERQGGIAIPAHIDAKRGLLEKATSLNRELRDSLKSVYAGEFCDVREFGDVDPSLKKAIGRLAKVHGSDAHEPKKIGQRFSWIKMDNPSITGLSLALKDYIFCVKNQTENPNRVPDIFLLSLIIADMYHCGRIPNQQFATRLHPHFNAVIGGRGTGKSTILESIRIASQRAEDLPANSRMQSRLDNFMRLAKDKGVMLDKTRIALNIRRQDKDYQLQWFLDRSEPVLFVRADGSWERAEPGDIKKRFPIRILSQGEINELASDTRGLLQIIDQSPEVNKAEWELRWKETESQFFQLRERRRELLRQLGNVPNLRTQLTDVKHDLKKYEEKGHGDVLKQYQKRIQQWNALPRESLFKDFAVDIREVASGIDLSDFPTHMFDEEDETTGEMEQIHSQASRELEDVKKELEKLASRIDEIWKKRVAAIQSSEWIRTYRQINSAYEKLQEEYKTKESNFISVYGEWVQRRNQLQQQLNREKATKEEVDSIEKSIEQLLEKFADLRLELCQKRSEFLKKVIGENSLVSMEIVPYGDVSKLEEKYRELLGLEAAHFTSSILDPENRAGLLWKLYNWEGSNCRASNLPKLIATMKLDTSQIAGGQISKGHKPFRNRLQRLLAENASAFDRLESWWPEDLLRVKYSRAGKFEDIEKGSAGQRAAAILAFLLSYGNEPLIIDQPEDDLDNALVYDLIVRQIQESKSRRQLVIVTHNPNIVVNGDAELVQVLKFANGQIQKDQAGGLGDVKIRNAVCTIMEGGEDAFKKRYERIMPSV